MIDLEILRRKAKRGISFPKQTPRFVELFGVRCLAIGFYRGDERRVLFIAEKQDSIMVIRFLGLSLHYKIDAMSYHSQDK